MVTEIFIEHFISKGEQLSDRVYNKTKSYLPFIARLCLLSSFIQEKVMLVTYWKDFVELFTENFDESDVDFIITVYFIARALGCVMVLFQKKVTVAFGLLFTSSVLQMMLPLAPPENFMINAAILGSLIILLAESKGKANSLFAGVPILDNNKRKNYLKLSGRILIMLMFLNFISLEASFLLIIQDILGCVLMVLVVLGYKTKLSVLAMILYLNVINIYENQWWTIQGEDEYYQMFVKHRFLQGISVTGGLLMIVLHGPGGISIDEAKKRW